jgi:aconitate hydratase 2/2-methylisocitrate dehydratase
MDQMQLIEEGYYATYGKVGARTEMPGCSLCMGNQARVADKSTVVSTSTRNFPNRLGKGANVFLASAELAAVAAIEGKLPTVAEYNKYAANLHAQSKDIFRYMNFDRLPEYVESAKSVDLGADYKTAYDKELARLKAMK